MSGTLHLACPCAIPPRFAYMVDESTLWHNQVKEEMYLDNEMADQLYLCSSLF